MCSSSSTCCNAVWVISELKYKFCNTIAVEQFLSKGSHSVSCLQNACRPSHKHKHTSTGMGAVCQVMQQNMQNIYNNVAATLCNKCISCEPHLACCCVQALIVGVKLVLYNGAALVFAACLHAVATSPLFWRMCKDICSQMGPVPTEVQAFLVTLTFAGCCVLLEEVWYFLSTDAWLPMCCCPSPHHELVHTCTSKTSCTACMWSQHALECISMPPCLC